MTDRLVKEHAALRLEIAQAYQRLFSTDLGQLVLEDLTKFAHGGETCIKTRDDGSICPYQTMRANGRREVLLRIEKLIDLDISALHTHMMETSQDDWNADKG